MREREQNRQSKVPEQLEVINTTLVVTEENVLIEIDDYQIEQNTNEGEIQETEINNDDKSQYVEDNMSDSDKVTSETPNIDTPIVQYEDTEQFLTNDKDNSFNKRKSIKLYKCENCTKMFAKKAYAISHCKKQRWQCEKCGNEISNVQNIKRHIERCNKVKPTKPMHKKTIHMCQECGEQYPSNSNLLRHRRAAHELILGEEHCIFENCGFVTSQKKYLKKHVTSTHSTGPTLKCKMCEYECLSKSGLLKHMLAHHGKNCPHCDQVCESDDKVKKHIQRAHRNVAQSSAENS